MTEEKPEERPPEEQPEERPPEEQPEEQPPEEQPEEQPDIGGEAKALRLVSRLAGAAVSVPVVTGHVALGAAVLVRRTVLDVASEACLRLDEVARAGAFGEPANFPTISTPYEMLFQEGEWTPEVVRGVKTQIRSSATNRLRVGPLQRRRTPSWRRPS
jgi:hypothetical protein